MSQPSRTQATQTPAEREQTDIGLMRLLRRERPAKSAISPDDCSPGQRIADRIAGGMGSWSFYRPALSAQAAYAAPLIMMSQNRQAEIDRANAAHDFEVNLKAEHEVKALHAKLNLLHEELERMRAQDLAELAQMLRALSEKSGRDRQPDLRHGA